MKRLSNEKRPYEVPQLTAVSFKMERGYAGSGPFALSLAWSNKEEDAWDGDTE